MPRTGRLIPGFGLSLARKVSLEIARALRPFEFSTVLVRVAQVAELGAIFCYRVPYHEGCRSLSALRRQQEPRVQQPHVRGFELIEMPFGLSCCGLGGRFTTKINMISPATGEAAKAENRGAAFPAPTDSSYRMPTERRRPRSRVRTIHFASLLARTEDETARPAGRSGRESR